MNCTNIPCAPTQTDHTSASNEVQESPLVASASTHYRWPESKTPCGLFDSGHRCFFVLKEEYDRQSLILVGRGNVDIVCRD